MTIIMAPRRIFPPLDSTGFLFTLIYKKGVEQNTLYNIPYSTRARLDGQKPSTS